MRQTWNLAALAALLVSCASTPTYEGSAGDLAEELLEQVASRRDLREIRLFIDEFQPCERSSTGVMTPMLSAMQARHEVSSRRLRHEIMGVLAPKMNVLESDRRSPAVPGEASAVPVTAIEEVSPFELAATRDASAILVGNYAMDGDDLIVLLRVVDTRDYTILAAVEGVVPHGRAQSSGMGMDR